MDQRLFRNLVNFVDDFADGERLALDFVQADRVLLLEHSVQQKAELSTIQFGDEDLIVATHDLFYICRKRVQPTQMCVRDLLASLLRLHDRRSAGAVSASPT